MAEEKLANHCLFHSDHENRIKRNEMDITNIYQLMDKIRNRLPHWVTIVLALLTGIIGWLLNVVSNKGV